MNYRKIYADIIRRAKERPKPKCYTERHHIVPKSLGGLNKKENLAVLTAREHFICHWLLVKMYDKGTEERKKMLSAFFLMRLNPNGTGKRYISARVYEKYRYEYKELLSEHQKGKNNSMFGKMWFTNINDGHSCVFDEDPGADWIRGKDKLNGQSCSIRTDNKKHWSSAKERWDRFHSGNWKSLSDFDKAEGRSPMASRMMFTDMIPIYKSQSKTKYRRFRSDKSLIGKYE